MSRGSMPGLNFLGEKSPFVAGLFEEERSEMEANLVPNRRLGLILAFVLSLGLWAIIWVVVATVIEHVAI
jgi:hypothetical protein